MDAKDDFNQLKGFDSGPVLAAVQQSGGGGSGVNVERIRSR